MMEARINQNEFGWGGQFHLAYESAEMKYSDTVHPKETKGKKKRRKTRELKV